MIAIAIVELVSLLKPSLDIRISEPKSLLVRNVFTYHVECTN